MKAYCVNSEPVLSWRPQLVSEMSNLREVTCSPCPQALQALVYKKLEIRELHRLITLFHFITTTPYRTIIRKVDLSPMKSSSEELMFKYLFVML